MSSSIPLNIPLLALMVAVQFPIMILFPLLLGWWLHRRFGVGWGLFGAGILTFVASQVVHIPVNMALGLIGGGRGAALLPLPWLALVAGASAGFFETLARWVALRFVLKSARGWRPALQFGAGHGGGESIILGLLAVLTLVNMLILRSVAPSTLGLQGPTAEQTMAAVAAFWGSAWYVSLVGALERIFAITFHIAAAVLVMRSITHRQPLYLLAAFAGHALMDAWAVWAGTRLGILWTEVGLGVVAGLALAVILALREDPPPTSTRYPDQASPEAGEGAPPTQPAAETQDALSQRVADSRFD